ncbi:hypothetical protein [Anaerorhabdus sp.]|uniref:hypothetical protein n=1 Tax=Anaerorhabdus sp. TaxID=1872524 RepID=UPI002FCA0FBA
MKRYRLIIAFTIVVGALICIQYFNSLNQGNLKIPREIQEIYANVDNFETYLTNKYRTDVHVETIAVDFDPYPKVEYVATLAELNNLKYIGVENISIDTPVDYTSMDYQKPGLNPFAFINAYALTELYKEDIQNIFEGYNIELYVFQNQFLEDIETYYKDIRYDKSLSFYIAVESSDKLAKQESILREYTQSDYKGEVRGEPMMFSYVYYVDNLDCLKRIEDLFWANFSNPSSMNIHNYLKKDSGFTEFRKS